MRRAGGRGTGSGNGGSALVIALVLLVILTALGIYAVSISISELEMANAVRQGNVARDAAEAGAYTGIDGLPVLTPATNASLPNGATYDYTPTTLGTEPMPGYDSNWARATFNVRATGRPQLPFIGPKSIDAGVGYGPIPSGTGY